MPKWTKEQQEAIDLDNSNIIVSAGAGSGKTAVLSERVLRKLKDKVNIDQLLILTFTKAAAEEMKIRIRKKIAASSDLKEQLERIDNAYITTFDSYALAIVKKYNYLLNVSKNISIIDASIIAIKRKELIEEVFDELYKSKNEKFLKFIDDFCTKDDASIKKAILQVNEKLDMRYDKDDYLDSYIDNYFNDSYIMQKIDEYVELILNKIDLVSNNIDLLAEYVDSDYMTSLNEEIGELLISNNYNQIKVNLITSIPRLPKNSSDEAKEIKDSINKTLKEIASLCSYEDIEELKTSIYKTLDHTKVIIDIIKRLDKLVNKFKFQQDLYEFNDIAKMAIKLLEDNENIRTELKNSLNEIMIDEYQDTNDLQEKFISLIENNNVYMVGDIKQSIYRFRNANPNNFKNKYDNYSKENNGRKIDLNKNFRSREEVLNNINLIFNLIMDNNIGGADYEKTHQMVFGNTLYNEQGKTFHSNDMEILNYPFDKKLGYTKEEIEIFAIANDIKKKINENYEIYDKDANIKRPLKYEDIVILMDRSTHFNLYKKIFEYLKIPMAIYKDESITDSIDISIIKNIIYLILNKYPNQTYKYAFISILRSYLFAEDDAKIFDYFMNNNYEESSLMKLVNSIDYQELNPKELVEEIVDKFDIYNKIIKIGDVNSHIAIFGYLIDTADNLSKIGYTVEDFYNYLCELQENSYDITISSSKPKDGVKIMTIHKSKGLEYHLCYFSGLYAKFNLSDVKQRFMYDKDYGIISPFIDRGIRQTFYKDLIKNKQLQEEISEKIRLFYVALTRAKEKMIFIAPLDDNSSHVTKLVDDNTRLGYMSFLDILNSIKGNILKYITNVDLENIALTHDYNFIKKYNFQELIEYCPTKLKVQELNLETNFIEEKHFSKVSHKLINKNEQENMEFGNYFHEIMENINFANPDYNSLNDLETKKVKAFINSGILDNAINLYKEYEFSYKENDTLYHGFIDLLIEEETSFKIVDYKLQNTQDEDYKKQLKGYKNYIENKFKKPVRVYLYSILKESLEEIKI